MSSFGDFDYVRSTFQLGISDYILKPQLEGADLLKALKQAAHKIPEVVLVDNCGEDVTVSLESMIDRVMTGFGLDEDPGLIRNIFSHSHFCLLGIDIRAHINHKKSVIWPLIVEIEGRVKSDFTHIEIHRLPVTQNIMAFMFNFELNQLQTVKEFIKMISMSLTFIDTKVGWALTEPFTEFLDLKQVYQNSARRTGHKMY
ncbi:hypothetical protein [Sporosarcina psychrophila]|uniref:hypothetical protein n=1 Tax=Sporosarcina psychrophila TaxID=1476 RepID=UPI00078BE890|nr:hypothetical protein [Sporosarcina psychrophila]AMQ06230.1 hypothetical protein AZE41_09990 [Sporosarcina psychrophila]